MKNIAIIGAAGFVGQYVVDEFNKLDIVPTTITRSNGNFLLGSKKVRNYNILSNDIKKEKFDIVINLAYPTGDKQYKIKQNNKAIVELIANISSPKAKIIHTSTLAVFGFDLSRPIKLEKQKFRHDWPYVESKIHFENILLDNIKEREVHIVRFGNVWGPKSKNWTVPLMNNVCYEQPSAILGLDGYSNTTDVHNAANYLVHLSLNEFDRQTRFHHLAEFYDVRWSFFLKKFSEYFKVNIEYLNEILELNESLTLIQDLKKTFSKSSPVSIAKELYKSKIAGSYLRSIISKMPSSVLTRLERQNTVSKLKSSLDNHTFFTIMSCQRPFVNQTVDGWSPVVSLDESWRKVEDWIGEIGFKY